MSKKIISLLLSVCMLLTASAQNLEYVRAENNSPSLSVAVTHEGEESGNIVIPQNARKTLKAVLNQKKENVSWQWQVLADIETGLWVNIMGQEDAEIELGYAMLSSVLDASGSAYIRCAAVSGEEKAVSDPVSVTVSFTANVPAQAGWEAPPQKAPEKQRAAMPFADDEYVYITINYLDAKEGTALNGAYTSQIRKGTVFYEVVHSPTHLGFAPYYYPEKWDAPKPDTNLDNPNNTDNPEHQNTKAESANALNFSELLEGKPVTEDVKINVYYWAVDVPYAVKYFFQNINDDYYTEQTNLYYASKAKTGTIIEDDEIFEHAGSPVGLTALYHYPEAVAADGSTVFECYYDRNYYLMKFDMNGGYGVEPVYARYETPFVVNSPSRPGYKFIGWDELTADSPDGDGQADAVPATIPTENKSYRALWEKAETKYTVVYWRENADDDGYSFWGYNQYDADAEETVTVNMDISDAIGVVGDPEKKEETKYFTYNKAKSDQTVKVEGDGSTIANVYYDRNMYTLVFWNGYGDGDYICGLEEHHHNEEQCSYQLVCKLLEHTHDGDCKNICGQQEHQHDITCYGASSGYHVADSKDVGYGTVTTLEKKTGYVYRYRNNTTYNYFYDGNDWYYLGTGTQYRGLQFDGTNPGANKAVISSTQSPLKCTTKPHTHTAECWSCGFAEHTHTAETVNGGCYKRYCCGLEEHTHDADCALNCGLQEHTHEGGCCDRQEHDHIKEGCIPNQCPHTHTLTCYGAKEGNLPLKATSNNPGYSVVSGFSNKEEGQVYRVRTGSWPYQYHNYFYLNGTLYYLGQNDTVAKDTALCGITFQFSANPTNNNSPVKCYIPPKCMEHEHEDSCYSCGKEAHEHGDGNCHYICGFTEEHTHTAECWSCGQLGHTHKTSCELPEHTHSSDCKTASSRILYTIKAKYQQTIGDQWTEARMTAEKYAPDGKHWRSWSYTKSGNSQPSKQTSKVVNMTPDFCNLEDNHVYKLSADYGTDVHNWSLYYLFESFDQSSAENGDTRKKWNDIYYDADPLYTQEDVHYNTTTWGQKAVSGMTAEGISYYNQGGTSSKAYFYYTRSKHDIIFNIYGSQLKEKKDVPYGMNVYDALADDEDLQALVETPPYPDSLEDNAYEFGGWYTTEACVPGSEFDFEKTAMPAGNLMLYAKWTPVLHKVRFFIDYQTMLQYESTGDESLVIDEKVYDVPHGSVVGSVDNPVFDEDAPLDYTFGGWFYISNGIKTIFTPNDLPVRRDLNIFADWGSHLPQPYRIQYKKKGLDEKVADDVFGYAYQGSTRTFMAKAGDFFNQLYPQYNDGWFPTLSSHSITIAEEKPEDKEDPKNNTFTFEYVEVKNVPYMVRYVNKITGAVVAEEKRVATNAKAVVTERFKVVSGMIPDAFYKRLVLHVRLDENGNSITQPEDNVITFYYVEDATKAFYAIHYMMQIPGTAGDSLDDFVESDVHTEGTGDIGDQITVSPTQYTGYRIGKIARLNDPKGEVLNAVEADGNLTYSFEITADGTELYVYYPVKTYPYTVRYLENGTNTALAPPKTAPTVMIEGQESLPQYGMEVSEEAIDIANYTAIAPTQKKLTIRAYEAADQSAGKEDPNVITFYYLTKSYAAEYKVAGNIGGRLDREVEKIVSTDGEYEFKGSVPTADEGFAFEGWYLDEECTKRVEADGWVDEETNRLTPKVENDLMKPEPEQNVYYAKFKELTGDLMITRDGADDEGDGEQVFIYQITNQEDPSLTVYVTVSGNSSVTVKNMRYGTYTVEQLNDWSWRYADKALEDIEHQSNLTEVTFEGAAAKKKWLNGNSNAVKNQKQ